MKFRRSFKRNIEVPLGDPNNHDAPRRDCYEVPDHTIIDIGCHNHQNENGNILSKLIFSTKVGKLVEDTSSLRLLSDDNSGRQMISSFSLRQRLHLLLAPLYGDHDERMRHEIN